MAATLHIAVVTDQGEDEIQVPLEQRCLVCRGEWGTCIECNGVGTTPTYNGREILDLVKRHLFST